MWYSRENGACVPRLDCGEADDGCEHLGPATADGRADNAMFEACGGTCVARGGCGPTLPTVAATVTVSGPVEDTDAFLRQLRAAHGDGAALLSLHQSVQLSVRRPA